MADYNSSYTGVQIDAAIAAHIAGGSPATLGDGQPILPSILPVIASRSLALTDSGDILEVDTSGGAVVITIPTNTSVAFPIGTVINITLVDPANAATVTASATVSLNGVSAGSGVITSATFAGISLYKRGTNSWAVQGQIGTVA